jgi:hypothetical protein
MENGFVYTAHFKAGFCTIHQHTKPTKYERRRGERKTRNKE